MGRRLLVVTASLGAGRERAAAVGAASCDKRGR